MSTLVQWNFLLHSSKWSFLFYFNMFTAQKLGDVSRLTNLHQSRNLYRRKSYCSLNVFASYMPLFGTSSLINILLLINFPEKTHFYPFIWNSYYIQNSSVTLVATDGRPERRKAFTALHGRKFNPNPNFSGTTKAYCVCHIGPIFQISLIYAFIGCP